MTSEPKEPDPESASTRAEELYGEYLAALQGGGPVDFDALPAAHPELADELRALHAEWEDLEGLRQRLAPPGDDAWDPLRAFVRPPWERGPADPQALLAQIQQRRAAIERYRFLGEVGRGGMGAVLRVHDDDLRRDLAMKVMLVDERTPSSAASPTSRSLGRFLEEAQVTGQLDHPGIVPVHDVGLDAQGRVYFTMKLVDGHDLSGVFRLVRDGLEGWTTTRALGVIQKVCEAMSYAHAKGVVHRDLKPANIMVGSFGAVYVMDWGLARILGPEGAATDAGFGALFSVRSQSDSGSGLFTLDGDVIGTPAYMSPEQAHGKTAEIGPATDIYAVGAMLYHLLAGRAPFSEGGTGHDELVRRVQGGALTPLSALAPDQPAELIAIADKAMAREAQARYSTMEELAVDLRAFLEGRVVRAYETGAVAELKKWVRRNRSQALATAAGVLFTIVGLGTAAWVQTGARAQEQLSNRQLAEVNQALERTNASLEIARNEALVSEERATERAAEATRQKEAADHVVDFLVGLFQAPDPANARGNTITADELLARGVQTIERAGDLDPGVRSRLLSAMGSAYSSLGLYSRALPLFERSQELLAGERDAADAELLSTEMAIGKTLTELGRLDEALSLLEANVEEHVAAFGPHHENTLRARSNVLAPLDKQGRYAEVIERSLPLLEDVGRSLGPDHPLYLSRKSDLAHALFRTGETERGIDMIFEVWQASERTLGADHPATIKARSSLASLLYITDDFRGAIEHIEPLVEPARRVLGEEHTQTLSILSNLALCYMKYERAEESEALQLEVLEAYRRVLGEDHDDTLITANNLSSVYFRTGRLDQAEALIRQSHEATVRRHGTDHPLVYTLVWNLAHVAAARGDAERAEELFLEALDGRRRAQGREHIETLEIVWTLADFYRAQGRYGEALELAEELVRATPTDALRYPGRLSLRDELAAKVADRQARTESEER